MLALCCILLANSMIRIMYFLAIDNVLLISKSRVYQHFHADQDPSLYPSLMRTDPVPFSYSHTLGFDLL